MLNIELNEHGIGGALIRIREYLEKATESNSKKQKNEMIYKALGAVDTLNYMIDIIKVDDDYLNKDQELLAACREYLGEE